MNAKVVQHLKKKKKSTKSTKSTNLPLVELEGKHTVILVDSVKTFDKIRHFFFYSKHPQKTRNKGELP